MKIRTVFFWLRMGWPVLSTITKLRCFLNRCGSLTFPSRKLFVEIVIYICFKLFITTVKIIHACEIAFVIWTCAKDLRTDTGYDKIYLGFFTCVTQYIRL